jgi:hypothetical protein
MNRSHFCLIDTIIKKKNSRSFDVVLILLADRSANTIDVLGGQILPFCDEYISDSSGTAMGGKELNTNELL